MNNTDLAADFVQKLKAMAERGDINRGVASLSLMPETCLYELYLDSLDKLTLLAAIQAEYEVRIEANELSDMDTMGEIAKKIVELTA